MKRIFLVGFPRSGTTLVQQRIAENFQIYTTKETHFFSILNPKTKIARLLKPKALLTYNAIKQLERVLEKKITKEFDKTRDPRNIFIAAMDSMAQSRKMSGWLEKTPRHLYFIDEILRFAPDAYFIHVIRNGEDASASLAKAGKEHASHWGSLAAPPLNKEQAENKWNSDISISHKFIDKKNHIFIIYEDFIRNEEQHIKNLSNKLGIPVKKMTAPSVIENFEKWKDNNKSNETIKSKSSIPEHFFKRGFDIEKYNDILEASKK